MGTFHHIYTAQSDSLYYSPSSWKQNDGAVMVKIDPPGTDFSINKDARELILKWTPSEKFGPPPTVEKT